MAILRSIVGPGFQTTLVEKSLTEGKRIWPNIFTGEMTNPPVPRDNYFYKCGNCGRVTGSEQKKESVRCMFYECKFDTEYWGH